MKALKLLFLVVGGFIALIAAALVAVWLLVDPNDYKDRIAAAVKSSTGRTLAMPGKLKLSLFPWIAIETGEASLGNPQGFGAEPFLTLRQASLRVRLMPLLHSDLQIGRIQIDGLDLRLKQNESGKGNWEDWGSDDSKTPDAQTRSSSGKVNLEGVSITHSRIAFNDMVADNVNLDMGQVTTGKPVPVKLSLDLKSGRDAKVMPIAAAFDVSADLQAQRYSLAKLTLEGTVSPAGAPKPAAWKFTSPSLALDLTAQTLAETGFDAKLASMELAGTIAGTKLVDAPALAGHFALKDLAPREVMQQFGVTPPVTRDKTRLSHFKAEGSYAWGNKVARTEQLKMQLDDSALTGRFAYDTTTSGMDFALTLDRIDLDRYQPPPVEATQAKSEPIELPVDFLKPLRAKGTFAIGEIHIAGVRLTQFSAGIVVQDQVARFAPLKASVYDGQYAGDIGIDMRSATPRLSLDEHLVGIDMGKLMKDFADTKRLSGKGTLNARLNATGRNGIALAKTLNGSLSTNLENGAVEGIDVWYAISQAQSLLKNQTLAGGTNTKRTAFDTFRASADVVNGVATTKDLSIGSQLLQITGQGSSNLVTQVLDYSIKATVLKTPPGSQADLAPLARASIPVRITGTFDDPKVRPDLNGLVKERVKEEIDKHKDEVKEKVKNKLKGLFNH